MPYLAGAYQCPHCTLGRRENHEKIDTNRWTYFYTCETILELNLHGNNWVPHWRVRCVTFEEAMRNRNKRGEK